MKLYLNCVKWKCAILYNSNVVIQTETLVYPTPSYGKKTPKLKLLKVLKVLRTDSRKWLKLKQIKKKFLYNIN